MIAGLSPTTAAWLADALLVFHAGIVVFVVGLLPLVAVGGARGWAWVRSPMLRATHLLLIAVVVAQAWLGRLCPLTIWEQALRVAAGQPTHGEGFIAHWVGRWLYWDVPLAVFALIYTAFAAAVVWAWWRVPPRRTRR